MTTDYSNDDNDMYKLYEESNSQLTAKASIGIDQFTPKITRKKSPEQHLSYAGFFEEDGDILPEPGTQATYLETNEMVWVVNVDEKAKEATIELPDESRVYNVPVTQLTQ